MSVDFELPREIGDAHDERTGSGRQQRGRARGRTAACRVVAHPGAAGVCSTIDRRLLTWRVTRKHDTGADARPEAAIAKLFSTEIAFRAVDRSMQILGARGMSRNLPLEKWLRDLRVSRIVKGSSQLLRNQTGRAKIGPLRERE